MDDRHRWEEEVLRQIEWEHKHPPQPLNHSDPICHECAHYKPTYAGFRCVCGCMACFTSKYYKPI